MRWVLLPLFVLVACGRPVNADKRPDGTIAIQCPGHLKACRARAQAICPAGFDVLDAQGHPAAESYADEMFVRCRGAVSPDALGYRDCMAEASCNTGDRCVWSSEEPGAVGRCVRHAAR